LRVLVACEFSGRVRDAFSDLGHDAWSCDLLPSESPGQHYQCDIREVIGQDWDMLLAFPPCQHLTKACAGQWAAKQADGRQQAALDFVRLLMDAPIERICVENPVGRISTAIRKPDQIIQPWMFGDPWKKATCLWLRGLPPLLPSAPVEPVGYYIDAGASRRTAGRKERAGVFHDIGVVRKERAKERSRTFDGIARAMAAQWGGDVGVLAQAA
jgi:site-specific DNA-cytosine methylase